MLGIEPSDAMIRLYPVFIRRWRIDMSDDDESMGHFFILEKKNCKLTSPINIDYKFSYIPEIPNQTIKYISRYIPLSHKINPLIGGSKRKLELELELELEQELEPEQKKIKLDDEVKK
jgi:hypothetical protein